MEDTSRVICTLNRKKDNYNQSDLFVLTTDPVQPSSLRKSHKVANKNYRSQNLLTDRKPQTKKDKVPKEEMSD